MERTLVIPDYMCKDIMIPAVVNVLNSFKKSGMISSYTEDHEEDSTLYIVEGVTQEAADTFHAFNMADFCMVRGDV